MLIRHTFLYSLSRILPGALGLATTAVLTHFLDPQAYGSYGLGLAVIALTSSSLFDWLGLALLRFYASGRDQQRLLSTVSVMFVANCAIASVLATIALLTPLLTNYAVLILVSLIGAWIYSWFELKSSVLIAALRPMDYLWMNLTRAALVLAFATSAAFLGGTAIVVLASSSLGMLIASLLYPLHKTRLRARAFDREYARILLNQGLPLVVSLTLGGITGVVGRILLEVLSGSKAVGLFTAALLIAGNSVQLLAAGIGSATYPLAVGAVESGDATIIRRQLTENVAVLVGLLLPAGIGLACIAPNVAHLLVGESFVHPVTELIPWLAATAVIAGVRACYLDHAFHLGKNTRRLIWVMLTLAVASLSLNILWIPRYGYVGAAAASLVAYSLALVHAFFAGRACYRLPFPIPELCKIVVATIAMVAFMRILPEGLSLITLGIQIGGGALAYFTAIMALNVQDVRSRSETALKQWLRRHI